MERLFLYGTAFFIWNGFFFFKKVSLPVSLIWVFRDVWSSDRQTLSADMTDEKKKKIKSVVY